MLGLIYTTFAPGTPAPPFPFSSPLPASYADLLVFKPAQALRGHMRPRVLPIIWFTTFAIHAAEAYYVYTLCKKHKTGFIVGVSVLPILPSSVISLVFGF